MGWCRLVACIEGPTMSATHPTTVIPVAQPHDFVQRHPQLAPFLVAVAIVTASILAALAVTGLPA